MALFSGETTWFAFAESQKYEPDSKSKLKPSRDLITKKRKLTKGFIEKNLVLYQKQVMNSSKKQKDSDQINLSWLDELIATGTYQDKVSSLSLKVSYCSLHSLDSLDALIALSQKKYREAKLAIDSLRDLFLKTLLPPDRQLTVFSARPLVSKDIPSEVLICWLLEDEIKRRYLQFLTILQLHTQNSLTIVKKEALKTLAILLESHPEQEDFILTSIINRFVEKERIVASSVVHLLQKLLDKHYNMSMIVINRIDTFISSQPDITSRSVYLAVTFFGQIYFSQSDISEQDIPLKIIQICISCLSRALKDTNMNKDKDKKSKKLNRHIPTSKLFRSLFLAINRAFPYVKDVSSLDEVIDILFKSCYSSSIPLSIQSLHLLFKILKRKKTEMNRFYKTLYTKVEDINMYLTTSKIQFILLIKDALLFDKEILRTITIIKRLLQVGIYLSTSTILSILKVIYDIFNKNKKYSFLFQTKVDVKIHDSVEQMVDTEGLTLNVQISTKKVAVNDTEVVSYNPHKRDPLYGYSTKDNVDLYELMYYFRHISPDVQKLAKAIVSQERLEDGLLEAILSTNSKSIFHDTFAYVKSNEVNKIEKKRPFELVNTPEFLECAKKRIRPSYEFYRTYFTNKMELEGYTVERLKQDKAQRDLKLRTKPEDYDNEESDDEFAQKLAQDLMKQHGIIADIDD